MKKILILSNDFDGLYNFRKELIIELLNQGNQVILSSPFNERTNYFVNLGCEVVNTFIDRRGINIFKDMKLIREYKKLIKRYQPDKVITYTIKPNIYGGIACRSFNVSQFANITGLGTAFQKDNIIKKVVISLYKRAFENIKITFFENEGNRNVMVSKKIVDINKTFVLTGAGVNLSEFKYVEYPSNDSINFLFIGRIMKEKGVNEIFEVARRIKKEYNNVNFNFIGSMEENYLDLIEELQKENIINYYGFQRDVKKFISESHCILLPSYHEGMSNALLEGASMGRPIITSNINGCLESVRENESGYLCKVKDSNDLYEKVKQFINLSYDQKRVMGMMSRRHVEEVFDRNKVVKKTIDVINKY